MVVFYNPCCPSYHSNVNWQDLSKNGHQNTTYYAQHPFYPRKTSHFDKEKGTLFLFTNDKFDHSNNSKFAVSHAMSESVKLDNYELELKMMGMQGIQDLEDEIAKYRFNWQLESRPWNLIDRFWMRNDVNHRAYKKAHNQLNELDLLNLRLNIKFQISNENEDIYWDHERLGKIYSDVREHLEIEDRTKLWMKNFSNLRMREEQKYNFHNNQYGHMLERIIVYLIAIGILVEAGLWARNL